MVFNELSAAVPAGSRWEGRRRLEEMIRSAVTVADGGSVDLVSIRNWDIYGMSVGPGYTVSDWMRDGDRDLRKLFYKITTKIGLGEDIDSAAKDRFYASTFLVGDGRGPDRSIEARGLGLAHLLDGIAASLASEKQWCRSSIDLCHIWLDEKEQERKDDIQVVNLSQMADVETVTDQLYRRWRDDTRDRRVDVEGVRSITKVFRHLAFGLDVEEQFGKLAVDARRLIWNKLVEFDGAVRAWRRGGADRPSLPGVRSEGRATMDQFGEKRVHRDGQGEEATYQLHVSAGSCRIHFRVESESKVIEVGYVGRHLPTKKFH